MSSVRIKNKDIINKLNSGVKNEIYTAFEEIRLFGNADILPDFISFIFTHTSEEYRKPAIQVLNDIKDNRAIPFLMEAINIYRGNPDFHLLISSCWQSGLNFSPYMEIFISLVIEEDLKVAIEAFSVIEGNLHHLETPERISLADLIHKRGMNTKDVCKKELITALTNIMQSQGINDEKKNIS